MDSAKDSTPPGRDSSWIKNFFPGWFALVMATGIVSLAWHLQGYSSIAKALFWINIPAYLVLVAISVTRLVRFPSELIKDLTSHARGATFLTAVAGTCVLGKQVLALSSYPGIAKCLWIAAVFLWAILIYTFFTGITLAEPKPKLESVINGGWLLVIVATESICTLGCIVAPSFKHSELVLFVSLAAYVLGAMFYIVLITFILFRWIFRSMEANVMTPPYWINMGALAITTLGGARLLNAIVPGSILEQFRPFISGFTIFFWSTATWWIPLLVILGVWRHGYQKVPLRFDPQYWSLVFPLGMYSVATYMFAEAAKLPFLRPLPIVFAVLALIGWVATFVGMGTHLLGALGKVSRQG